MTLFLYSVRDALVDFGQPFCAVSDAVAIRSFCRLASDPRSDVFSSPDDYTLCRVGEYHTDTGQIVSEAPRLIYRGRQAVLADVKGGDE